MCYSDSYDFTLSIVLSLCLSAIFCTDCHYTVGNTSMHFACLFRYMGIGLSTQGVNMNRLPGNIPK